MHSVKNIFADDTNPCYKRHQEKKCPRLQSTRFLLEYENKEEKHRPDDQNRQALKPIAVMNVHVHARSLTEKPTRAPRHTNKNRHRRRLAATKAQLDVGSTSQLDILDILDGM